MISGNEELLVKIVFENQLIFCSIFGALGGIVHSLDVSSDITIKTLITKVIVSSSAGVLLFFSTHDIAMMSPSLRIATSIVCGFYGTALFRYLAKLYLRQAPGIITEKILNSNDFRNDGEKKSPDINITTSTKNQSDGK